MSPDLPEQPSWLSSLRAGRPTGWDRLVTVFAPVVRVWCQQRGLQPADADEVTQDVFVRVGAGIGAFQPGNFVAWIYRITQNAIRDHFRRRARSAGAVGGTDFAEHLAQLPAPEDGTDVPEPARLVAVRRAMDVVRRDVKPRTWRAFEAVVIEGYSTADVAAELGMTEPNVRNAKARVLQRIREELGADS
ncbi:MAG TPA: sigma-70 family RNA polymerase sigma factor [Gemmata sp.]